ncbi:uncharacterized protein LOC117123060 [Anneissia japonica]|uniref:uncharacterized protein LOC117123060 n=1 Tax=Anneissia japonica TaxID=1529436 RepID=UPI0014255ADF|nr:uncharacterized protein LOC117123060 [Anneissia japonica]
MNTIIFVCVVFSAIVGTSGFIHDRLFPEDVAEMFAGRSERRLRVRRAVNQAIHLRQRRSAAAQVTGNIEVFTDLDGNDDGYITETEYREFNTRELNDDVTAIFKQYDKNDDQKISKTEFFGFLDEIDVSSMSSVEDEAPISPEAFVFSSSSLLSSTGGELFESESESSGTSSAPPENCELKAMRKCDGRFLDVLDLLATDEDAFCKGFQAYIGCVFKDIVPCNMDEYVQNVINVGNIYKDLDVCPDLDFTSLETYDTLERSRRSPTTDNSSKHGLIKNGKHLKKAVSPCNEEFVRSSHHKKNDFCTVLTQYRHCVLHAVRPYRSESVNHLRDGLKYMTREHRRTHVCAGND